MKSITKGYSKHHAARPCGHLFKRGFVVGPHGGAGITVVQALKNNDIIVVSRDENHQTTKQISMFARTAIRAYRHAYE